MNQHGNRISDFNSIFLRNVISLFTVINVAHKWSPERNNCFERRNSFLILDEFRNCTHHISKTWDTLIQVQVFNIAYIIYQRLTGTVSYYFTHVDLCWPWIVYTIFWTDRFAPISPIITKKRQKTRPPSVLGVKFP